MISEEVRNWNMPRPAIGTVVQYFPGSAQEPAAALVTSSSNRSVGLAIWHPNFVQCICLDGVRHRRDPDKYAIESTNVGTWDFLPQEGATNTYDMRNLLNGIIESFREHEANNSREFEEMSDRINQLELLTARMEGTRAMAESRKK